MKKIFNLILLAGTAASLLFSCRPMDLDDHQLGAAPSEDQLSFSCAPSAATPNILEFTNTSSVKGVALWDLGNGTTVKGDKVSATYPFKGDYTVTMSLYTPGGSATISQVVTIAADDYGLLDTARSTTTNTPSSRRAPGSSGRTRAASTPTRAA